MQILIAEIENMRKELNSTIIELNKAGYEKAKAEYTYRVALAKELLINRDKGLPVTLTNDVSKGNEQIAKYKFDRDVAETNYEAILEKLRAIKIELGIVERQIEATRRGE
ncbi:hypothetical protein [Tissierella sp. Yu-01]|uniref:hypothetical protein n=1 Tax=Tissierella sp. Yu-01 TaxID=3035694 RepID=UPI00240DA000|nr:hypothetical protein [Tissierella sp. Yu-01]WFA10353.1 hypothetical protein P3962_07315 [Tissierella sp. Yu-01]